MIEDRLDDCTSQLGLANGPPFCGSSRSFSQSCLTPSATSQFPFSVGRADFFRKSLSIVPGKSAAMCQHVHERPEDISHKKRTPQPSHSTLHVSTAIRAAAFVAA